ncbi:MAG: response regulator [Betaproteobacteria bacterium]|nr:MAG: response regulator [Betaproteobacteria bacterium]
MNETAKTRVEVLVIDDDAIMRELMADWLEAAGYRVRQAGDCGTALAEFKRQAPAL